MMRLDELFLREGRDAPLFHGTGVREALNIILSDELRDRTPHTIWDNTGMKFPGGEQEAYGVSFTRSYRAALVVARGEHGGFRDSSADKGGVVFVVDQGAMVRAGYKFVPIDFAYTTGSESPIPPRSEAEEFCIGSVKPLSKFLISVNIEPIVFNTVMDRAIKKGIGPNDVLIKRLMNHHLLNVYKGR